ncbi:MAG: hypothetical protein PHX51_07175 [Clostridia bacterium]|nr:hypothetical protein [Clostridia bacterium]
MGALDKEIHIKLIIDGGREITTTAKLAADDIEKLKNAAAQVSRTPMLRQFSKELLEINESSHEAVTGIMDFIKYNQLSEEEIDNVIRALKEQQSVLSVTSTEYKQHQNAIGNLTTAYAKTQAQQIGFAKGSNSARMAVSQFGFALGDAGMIAVDFRMFLLSIGNNLPFIVQGLAQVSQEAKAAGMSMGQFLKNNIDMSMKLVLGANALMFALMVLPAIFQKINESSDDAATGGMKKFTEELQKMTSDQIIDKLDKIRLKIKNAEEERKKFLQSWTPSSSDEWFPAPVNLEQEKNAEKKSVLTDEEKKILDLKGKQKASLELEIEDYDKKIDQVKKGADAEAEIVKLRDEQALKQKELNDLLMTTEEREKKRTDEIEKQKQKHDEYISKIVEKYELETRLNELQGNSNVQNILSTGKLIAQEANRNQTLENRIRLLELQKKLADELYGFDFSAELMQKDNEEIMAEADKEFAENREKNIEFLKEQIDARKKLTEMEHRDKLNSIKNEFDLERQLLAEQFDKENNEINQQYADGLITKEEFERAKYLIEQYYSGKSLELDKQQLLSKLDMAKQVVDTLTSAYDNVYNAMQSSVRDEIDSWKNKEEEKLEAERDAALKSARTAAQRERINERYDKKRDQLEEDAQARAKERLAGWFALQKAANIAQATMATYKAADEQLSMVPVGPWNIALAAAIIAAGLANVAVIASQEITGYEKGGILPKGKMGFFEGYENEIVAPEKDFATAHAELMFETMNLLRTEMHSGSFSAMGNNSDLLTEIKEMRKEFKHYADNPPEHIITDSAVKKIYNRGNALKRRSKI